VRVKVFCKNPEINAFSQSNEAYDFPCLRVRQTELFVRGFFGWDDYAQPAAKNIAGHGIAEM
jgi:hypothetical protein